MRRFLRRLGLAVSVTAITLSLGAGSVFAGEVTGSGKNSEQNQGKSWCSFSGLNDRNEGEGPTDTQAQSYGQDVAAGAISPHEANPGFFCNPNHTPLPPNPNRTH